MDTSQIMVEAVNAGLCSIEVLNFKSFLLFNIQYHVN